MIRKSIKKQLMNTAAASVIAAAVAAGCMAPAFADESGAADQTAAQTTDSQAASLGQAAEETEAGIPADDWLPIGSIVTVKGFKRSFLVLGRLVQNSTDQKFYDYCGCLFPDGYMGGDLYFFDQKDIEKTVQRGFEDEYESLFRKNHLDGLSAGTVSADSQAGSGQQAAAGTSVSGSSESETAAEPQSETAAQPQSETAAQSQSETAAQPQSETAAEPETQKQSETENQAGQAKTYTTTDNVRLRSDASTDSDIIVTIPAQRQVTEDTARKPKGDWIPVIFRDSTGTDQKGWVKKEFLK